MNNGTTIYTNSEEARLNMQELLRAMYPNATGIHTSELPDPFKEFTTLGNSVGISGPLDNNNSFTTSFYTGDNRLVVNVAYSKSTRDEVAKSPSKPSVEKEEQALHAMQAMFLSVAKSNLAPAERSLRLLAIANTIKLLDAPLLTAYSILETDTVISIIIGTYVEATDVLKEHLNEENVAEVYSVNFLKH